MEKQTVSYLSNDFFVLSKDSLLQIEKLIELRENIVVEFMAGGGKSRFCSLFTKAITPQRHFVLLDQRLDLATCKELLNTYVQINFQTNTVIEALSKLQQSKSVLYLVIDNFNFENLEILNYLGYLRNLAAGAVRFILAANARMVESTSMSAKAEYSFLLSNKIRFYYLDPDRAQAFFLQCVEDLPLSWPKADLKIPVFDYLGGIPHLIKGLVRLGKHYPSFEETFQSTEFVSLLQIFWQRFSSEEQQVIKTFCFTGTIMQIPVVTDLLEAYGLIKAGRKYSKWLGIVTANNDDGQFQIINDKILWDDVDFTGQFTKVELVLLRCLVSKQGELLTRDEIVTELWGENADLKYSAGAVDKTISRLRLRFKELGLPAERLATLKLEVHNLR